MPFLDIAIIFVITVSSLVGLIRGFTRELMSIIAWVLAIYCAINFHEPIGQYLLKFINNEWVSNIAAMIAIFVVVLFLFSMVGFLISKAVAATGIKGTDRVLGSVLGLVRGVLIIGCFIVIGSIFNVQNTNWWQNSKLIDQFVPVANTINNILPEKFRNTEPVSAGVASEGVEGVQGETSLENVAQDKKSLTQEIIKHNGATTSWSRCSGYFDLRRQ